MTSPDKNLEIHSPKTSRTKRTRRKTTDTILPSSQEASHQPEVESRPRIVVCIDDNYGMSTLFPKIFELEGVEVQRPVLTRRAAKEDPDSMRQAVLELMNNFPEEKIPDIEIIMIDQFYDDKMLRPAAVAFIKRVRALNTNAYILETSAQVSGKFYPGSDATFEMYEILDLDQLLRSKPKSAAVVLGAFRFFTRLSFLESARFDRTESTSKDYLDRFKIDEKYDRLTKNKTFEKVLELLMLEAPYQHKVFRNLPLESQADFLHFAWTCIGHLELGSERGFYAGPLDKLRKLIVGEPTPAETSPEPIAPNDPTAMESAPDTPNIDSECR